MDRAFEAAALKVCKDRAPHVTGLGRDTDDCDRARLQQPVDARGQPCVHISANLLAEMEPNSPRRRPILHSLFYSQPHPRPRITASDLLAVYWQMPAWEPDGERL